LGILHGRLNTAAERRVTNSFKGVSEERFAAAKLHFMDPSGRIKVVEYGFTSNWSIGAEYDHLFMGNANNSFSVVNPIVAGALNRISLDVDMVTIRFNYRFGGYGAELSPNFGDGRAGQAAAVLG
jgi:hypothetical protein